MNNKQTEDIKAIREMMERSTKFISLNGMSGIIAGIAALAGASLAWLYLLQNPAATNYSHTQEALILLSIAAAVLIVSIGAGLWLAWRKAHKSGQKLMNRVTYRILYAMFVPLLAGGVFCLIYLLRGDVRMVIAATLIFYGVALVAASKYTYREIHYLGLTEIVLGLAAALFDRNGMIFWALGFGVCHIVYGLVMYLKYDKCNDGRIDFEAE
jgi:hypothetical protein